MDEKRMAALQPVTGERETERRPAYGAMPEEIAVVTPRPIQVERSRRYAWLLSPLWLCLLVALVIRVWLTIRTHGTLDGDEALLGIQAEHILQGERPIYFYGIPYFGSLEAYLVALLFAIFGPSVAALRAETTAVSLGLVALTWWLASLLARAARLPWYAERCFATVAALIAALPPLYDGIVELRTGGGWIESFAIMLLLLIAALRLTTRWHEGASYRELALRWAGVGFLVGFGMWIYPLVSVAILPAALWIILDRLVEIVKLTTSSKAFLPSLGKSLKVILPGVTALPACVIGFFPGVIWGAENHWENIRYIFGLGGGWTMQRLRTVEKVSKMYMTCVAPRVIGGGTPSESPLLAAIHSPLVLFGVLCMGVTFVLVAASFAGNSPVLLRARRLAALPILLGASSALLYCVSSASASILISCNADFGGHYASPLVLALPFFFATVFTLVGMFLYEKGKNPARQPADATNITSLQAARSPALRRLSQVGLGLVCALLLAYLSGQATTYGLTSADQAFQSAYCTIAPANYAPIIAYMEKEHIHYGWATNLIASPISFETNNAIIMADPLVRIHPSIVINRIPAYTNAVANADRPSLLVLVRHGDPRPYLLQLLDSEHVTYKAAFFPSQPGVDVLVVTPLSRTVSPFESPSFDIFYCAVH
jgi:hypothetical protein